MTDASGATIGTVTATAGNNSGSGRWSVDPVLSLANSSTSNPLYGYTVKTPDQQGCDYEKANYSQFNTK